MEAAIYVRISEDREGRELGVTRQREDCMGLVSSLGANVYRVYIDNDRSASTRSRKARPEYAQMLRDARNGQFQVIVAYTSGRLTRRPREHEDQIELAERHGIKFRYVASPDFDLNTSAGRRIARILAANDAGEAEDIAERISRETLQRAQQGRPHGGPRPYGYNRNGTEVEPEEAARVESWFRLILAGGSIRGIRMGLLRDGIMTPAGKPWHDSSIRTILRSERYAGLRFLNGDVYPAAGPAIVAEETWQAVQAILAEPSRRSHHNGSARKWLGASLYLCDRCDVPVRTWHDGAAGKGRRTYACRSCMRKWKAEPIDAWITDVITERLARPDLGNLLEVHGKEGEAERLRAEAMGVRERMNQLAEEFGDGTLTAQQLRVATTRLRDRLAGLEQQLEELSQDGVRAALAVSGDPAALWRDLDGTDVVRRQAIVRTLCEIRLGTPIRGRAVWDPLKFITVNWV